MLNAVVHDVSVTWYVALSNSVLEYDRRTRQPVLIFPNVVAERHILGWGVHPGGYDPQIRTRPIFLYNAPTP